LQFEPGALLTLSWQVAGVQRCAGSKETWKSRMAGHAYLRRDPCGVTSALAGGTNWNRDHWIAVTATFETATCKPIGMPRCHMREDRIMSDDTPPFIHEGLDPAPEPKSTIAEVSEAVKGTAHRISGAIDAGRKPGMPLSILSNIAREAPLGSLLVAFLLGVAVARRR